MNRTLLTLLIAATCVVPVATHAQNKSDYKTKYVVDHAGLSQQLQHAIVPLLDYYATQDVVLTGPGASLVLGHVTLTRDEPLFAAIWSTADGVNMIADATPGCALNVGTGNSTGQNFYGPRLFPSTEPVVAPLSTIAAGNALPVTLADRGSAGPADTVTIARGTHIVVFKFARSVVPPPTPAPTTTP